MRHVILTTPTWGTDSHHKANTTHGQFVPFNLKFLAVAVAKILQGLSDSTFSRAVSVSTLWPPIIGADSTGATGNFAPVLTQEPGQTLRFAPVPFMAVV